MRNLLLLFLSNLVIVLPIFSDAYINLSQEKNQLTYQSDSSSNEYGWVQDIVGIEEDAFNYVEGSDPDLELYVKNAFFTDVALSPDGKHLAFQSKSDDFTEGLLVANTEVYFSSGIEKATVAKAAMENKPDSDLGVRALYLCDFNWVSNKLILVEVCGKRYDFIQGEIFQNFGIFKLFNIETKEFRNFLYPLEDIKSF